ncbi:MAG: hypothetical protein RL490_1734 [Pseudomonadota bacterium]
MNILRVSVLLAAVVLATAASARPSKLIVTGHILAGSDSGNDLIDVSNVGGIYVHTYAPGTFFGTTGSLVGKMIKFTMLYDPAVANAPVGNAGVFDDIFGDWALSNPTSVSVDGVSRDLTTLAGGVFGFASGSTITLGNDVRDSVAGDFSSLVYSGGNLTTYDSNAFHFAATLAGTALTTDTALPGALPGPHFGYGGGAATGTGSFFFSRSMCFIDCSSKLASGSFALSQVQFGAVPEPANWALLLAGFTLVGATARRRRLTSVAA